VSKFALYTDGHVPSAVAEQVRAKVPAVDIIRCEEIGNKHASDDIHWAYILEHQCVLITADQGFLARAADLNRQGKSHPGIIFIMPHMQGKPCIGPLVELIVFLHEAIESGAATLDGDIVNHIEHIS
jgi:uncharacterized protein DUF5615